MWHETEETEHVTKAAKDKISEKGKKENEKKYFSRIPMSLYVMHRISSFSNRK